MSHSTQSQRAVTPAFTLHDLASLLRVHNWQAVDRSRPHKALWNIGAIERPNPRKPVKLSAKGSALIAQVEAQAARFDAALRLAMKPL
jgi:hypothetical protein